MFSKLKQTTKLTQVKLERKFLNLPFNTLFNHITIWSLFSKIRICQEPGDYKGKKYAPVLVSRSSDSKKRMQYLLQEQPYQQNVARNTPVNIKWKNNTEKITRSVCAVLWSYLKNNGKIQQYKKLVEAKRKKL